MNDEEDPKIEVDKAMGVVKRVSRKRHHCATPSWWRRIALDLDYGSVWECRVCHRRWEWTSSYDDSYWAMMEKTSDE